MEDLKSIMDALRRIKQGGAIIEEKRELLKRLVEYFTGFPVEKGLVRADMLLGCSEAWEDYDTASAQSGIGTAVNLLRICVLRLAGEHLSPEYTGAAEAAERAVLERLYDKRVGLFRDADISMHYSAAVNALAVELEIFPHSGKDQIEAYLKKKKK